MAIKTKRFIASRKSCSCSMPGVWRAVAYCEGVVVIFHSPRACAHVARSMDINAQYRAYAEGRREQEGTVPLLSSQLEEKHSIFGGAERLEACLDYALQEYKPQCLVIANSCVAGVIGDDVEAVARKKEAQYGVPVLQLDCCGFLDGEYYQGYYGMSELLIKRFFKPAPKEAGSVFLVGDNGGPCGHYATEVTRLLQELQVKVIGQFPGYMPFKALPRATSAEAVIILGGRGQSHEGLSKIASLLKEGFGMPYLDQYPVGWQRTQAWLVAVGKLLQREELAAKALLQEKQHFDAALAKYLPVTKGKRVVLCIGRLLKYFHPESVLETIRLLQMDLTGIILLDAYDKAEREKMLQALAPAVQTQIYSAAAGEPLLEAADLVLTTHELQNESIKQIFLPMLPKVGTTGELEFMELIYRRLASRIKGGLSYV